MRENPRADVKGQGGSKEKEWDEWGGGLSIGERGRRGSMGRMV